VWELGGEKEFLLLRKDEREDWKRITRQAVRVLATTIDYAQLLRRVARKCRVRGQKSHGEREKGDK
jgi:hypothetical protein